MSDRRSVLANAHGWWAMVAVVLLGTFAANRDVDPGHGAVAAAVIVAVLAVLPAVLPWRPEVAVAASGVCTAVYFGAGFADGPIFLALPTVTFVAVLRATSYRWVPWATAAAVLAATALVLRMLVTDGERTQEVWQAIGLLAVVAAAGAVATVVSQLEASRADRTARAASEEQLRMAQDLHDGVGHGLAVIAMQAGVALHLLDRDPEKARESLEAIRATSRESLDALRTELGRMAGAESEAARRPARGLRDLDALIERVRAGGLEVDREGEPGAVDDRIGEVAYAVVQEGLTNTLRHADASRAVVAIVREPGTVVVSVRDDGRGAPAEGQDEGMGISGMRARVAELGGTLDVTPADDSGSGFVVRATLPDPA
ncbi:sensor histidine kinase [Mumia sp. zg.B17]|uniref:sensor histidine kinase n=1 Tax=unclassified Mumia TaxID=2621872 RepID=UPI001C6EF3EE|nr:MULTISPECIES: sensor histidine kinase [unclassified Mumia]MBW9205811.1 sensor histidine kinase [Mumia sp. zg.B17]MBW9208185.1 sensor histidine kinase [Mumia sp. zg.B21]